MTLDYQFPTAVTDPLPIGVKRNQLLANTVGAPPGAESYLICGINDPAVLVLTIPRIVTVIFSVLLVLEAVTTSAVAAVPYILLTVSSVLPVVLVVSAT